MSGPIESAIRASISTGQQLNTVSRRAPFSVAEIDQDGVVLLLGAGQHRTRFSWECLEGIPAFLRGRAWVLISGTGYSTDVEASTFDGYLKGHVNRATASWVAALLETAGIVEIDDTRPARVRLKSGA